MKFQRLGERRKYERADGFGFLAEGDLVIKGRRTKERKRRKRRKGILMRRDLTTGQKARAKKGGR